MAIEGHKQNLFVTNKATTADSVALTYQTLFTTTLNV